MIINQAISEGINVILDRAQLSSEMLQIIKTSLNVDSKNNGKMFKWAHLTLLNCECVGGEIGFALSGAIAMELAALAADIYDDIQDQDNDDLPWRQIPIANAMNLAICLSMLSLDAIATLSNDKDGRLYREISQILSDMWITASDGQLQEILLDTCEEVTLNQYFEIVKRKSGSLASCACKIGAILGGASKSIIIQLEQFGINFGIMSQIRNDLNDFLNFEKKNDFVKNRKTLPYVYLLNVLEGNSAEQFNKLTQMTEEVSLINDGQERLRQLVITEGVVPYCTVMYEIFRQKAMKFLNLIPVMENQKEKMIKLVEECI